MPARQGGTEDRDGDVALTPLDFPGYAALWREQTSPEELALLQTRARTIARSAGRRRLRDIGLTLLAAGMIIQFLWFHPMPLPIELGFAPLFVGVIGLAWWRHRITRAALAITADDPRAFFEAAIANVHAELRFSRVSLYFGLPIFVFTVWLVKAAQGIDLIDWLRRLPRDINLFGITCLTIVALTYVFFLREDRTLRAQRRRLEAMQREWEEQPGREE